MKRLESTCRLVCAATCFALCGPVFAADDLVIPGDNSKNLLDKVPLQITDKIEWNQSEYEQRLREKILSILSDADLFIEASDVSGTEVEHTVKNQIETHPDGQSGEVP